MKKVLKNVLGSEQIETLLNEFELNKFSATKDNRVTEEVDTWAKAMPGPAVEIINDFMYGYKRVGGNYYRHDSPYLPHTDHKEKWGNTINVIAPLHSTDPNAKLIVFDQKWHKDSVTWCLHNGVWYFEYNTGVKGRPYDYKEVEGLTDEPISDELYQYLGWADKKQWFGLTGDAMPFVPGDLLIFDNKYIHTTGKLDGIKIGLSLRYKL
jgi:hypothetical protein